MDVDRARALMREWTESESLRTHMEAVAACMDAYAARLGAEDREAWVVAGLLHDFDYEKHPSAEEHPYVGVRHLEELGVDAGIREAILGHAEYTGTARESAMAKALFAVDELAGFIVACAKVRPDGIESLRAKSVRKKLKDRSFAAAVSREDIRKGAEELSEVAGEDLSGEDLGEHVQRCIDAIRERGVLVGM